MALGLRIKKIAINTITLIKDKSNRYKIRHRSGSSSYFCGGGGGVRGEETFAVMRMLLRWPLLLKEGEELKLGQKNIFFSFQFFGLISLSLHNIG